jgi:peptidoglycan hydrolase-like protein with peptidoglycan-binding domain
MDAYALLCAALCNAYTLSPARVLGHKEVCAPPGRKIDPNIDMDVLRTAVVRDLAGLRAGRDEPRVPLLRRELLVRVPMQHGGDVEIVQRKVGARPDGWYGPLTASTVRAFQRRHKLLADGIVGPRTAHALGLRWAG